MCVRFFAVLVLASFAIGQAAQNSAKPGAPPPVSSGAATGAQSSVPPDAAVITIPDVCDASAAHSKTTAAAKKEGCETVITRARFEDLANALQPNMNAQTKRRLAEIYPRLLVMAQEARKRGLENDPKFKELVQFNRLQILSQELGRSIKEDADKVSDADIEQYYKSNPEAFEQATLLRLFVPKEKQSAPEKADVAAKETTEDPAKQAEAQKANEDAMNKIADSLQKRAAAGEDFEKLQKEAFDAAGISGAPASTNIGKMTRSQIPVNQRAVLDLKAGDVSSIFTEANGYYVYKVVSKETKPLDQAREEIRSTISQQRMQDAMTKFQQETNAKLNDSYFGPAQPEGPMMGAPRAPRQAPATKPQTSTPQSGTDQPKSPEAPPK